MILLRSHRTAAMAQRRLSLRNGAYCSQHKKVFLRRRKRRWRNFVVVIGGHFTALSDGKVTGRKKPRTLPKVFLLQLLERRDLDAVRREKGRMRSYLLVALKNFLGKAHRRIMAVKRGGGRPLVPLDALLARERADQEPADHLTADRIYERRWH